MNTITIKLTPSAKAALLQTIESTIDMLQDMAIDPMWLNPEMVRDLAGKTDDEIRDTFTENGKEADRNINQLVELQVLYAQLKSE